MITFKNAGMLGPGYSELRIFEWGAQPRGLHFLATTKCSDDVSVVMTQEMLEFLRDKLCERYGLPEPKKLTFIEGHNFS